MRRCILLALAAATFTAPAYAQKTKPHYLYDSLYFADPSAHLFQGKIFIYPSHDIRTEVTDGADGGHYNMKDYHVLSMDNVSGKAKDHGVALSLDKVPWASRQLWAPDCVYHKEKYYLYFPAKDKKDLFKIGVATSSKPEGPFKAAETPIEGSYSIDPAVFTEAGVHYMYFGGLKGGQLQRYRNNALLDSDSEPGKDEDALCPKVARLSKDMLKFDEAPRDVLITDANGQPLKAGDNHRRFFEGVWVHKYNNKYYLSYSTGDTHKICYATGDSPYGPFVYQGEILTPVVGWTTHHSIIEYGSKWYLFYHDSKPSGKVSYLRSMKVRELQRDASGLIKTMDGLD